MKGFARAAVARSLPAFLARYPHVTIERLLERAGITGEVLAERDSLLDFARWVEFAEVAAAETGDSALGAAFAEQLPWRDLGVLGYVILNSPTLGAALRNACRYFGLQQNVARMALEVEGTEARVVYRIDHSSIPDHAQHSEAVLVLLTRICRDGLQDPAWRPREVRFRHRRPASIETQRRLFRCPIEFEQTDDVFVLPADELRKSMRGADPELLSVLVQHADACLASTASHDDFTAQVTRLVIDSLSSGDATIEHVAMRLDSSPRTVQRRLREQGQSFKDVVARARLSLSERYLGDPSITLTEAAFLLGYSDYSAFSRAFRRWTGRSVVEFRRHQLRES